MSDIIFYENLFTVRECSYVIYFSVIDTSM
jgi:hypothetical protein